MKREREVEEKLNSLRQGWKGREKKEEKRSKSRNFRESIIRIILGFN